LGLGVVNGVLYVLGGWNYSTSNPRATVEVYDPEANSWTRKGPMPTSRGGLAVGVVNDVVYAVGGYDQTNGVLTTVEAYDPAQDR
jgi:kelch-like protein 2/3